MFVANTCFEQKCIYFTRMLLLQYKESTSHVLKLILNLQLVHGNSGRWWEDAGPPVLLNV